MGVSDWQGCSLSPCKGCISFIRQLEHPCRKAETAPGLSPLRRFRLSAGGPNEMRALGKTRCTMKTYTLGSKILEFCALQPDLCSRGHEEHGTRWVKLHKAFIHPYRSCRQRRWLWPRPPSRAYTPIPKPRLVPFFFQGFTAFAEPHPPYALNNVSGPVSAIDI